MPRSDETRPRRERACAVVSLYQRQLVHEDAQDVLVDVLTELRGYCKAHGWDFQYAVRRSLQEYNAELGNAAWFAQFLELPLSRH